MTEAALTEAAKKIEESRQSKKEYIERVLITLLILGFALLLWQLKGLLVLVFSAVLVAVIFNAIAELLREKTGIPAGLSLALAVVLVLGLVGGAFWFFGAEVAAQSKELRELVPKGWEALQGQLDVWGMRESFDEWVEGLELASGVGGFAVTFGSAIADLLLVLVAGIYIASQPKLYRKGIIKLVPESARPLAADAMDQARKGLRLWLLGQLISMAIVGVLTGLGLWIMGVPSALTLGLLAGLLEFVPLIGAFFAAVPAVLLAFAV